MPTGLLFLGTPCPFNKSIVNISSLSFFATDAVLSVVEEKLRELRVPMYRDVFLSL
jgi:hypothetical protein